MWRSRPLGGKSAATLAMLLFAGRQCKGLRMFSLSQKRRRFTATVTARAGAANGERVRQWFHDKKVGWYRLLEDRRMSVATTVLDQAHNVLDRKLFMMKGFHYPKESQKAFLNGLALLYNLVFYNDVPNRPTAVGWR